MSGGGIFKKLFGGKGKSESAAHVARSILPEMVPGPVLTLCLVYGRGTDDTIADYGLNMTFSILEKRKLKATFICAAKLAETSATQLARIRDHGHEIACHGYQQENPQKIDDMMFSRVMMRAREVMAKRGIHPGGYVPPTGHIEPRMCHELARQGFKYVAELRTEKHESPPLLVVPEPLPFVHIPISSNDSGYIRHPEDPRHVFGKHHGIITRTIHAKGFAALSYHTWMLGERKERLEDFTKIVDEALREGVKIMPFNDALPPKYRPIVREVARNEWGI